MLCPPASSSIACSTSTWADNAKFRYPGTPRGSPAPRRAPRCCRSAASECRKHQLGLHLTHQPQQLPTVTGPTDKHETRALQQAGQTRTQKHVILGNHHADESRHCVTCRRCIARLDSNMAALTRGDASDCALTIMHRTRQRTPRPREPSALTARSALRPPPHRADGAVGRPAECGTGRPTNRAARSR
jgi:hypothetical protein